MKERYLEWIKWERKQHNPLNPMTGNQAAFAKWLFENEKETPITNIGNLQIIFEHAQRFMKENRITENKK